MLKLKSSWQGEGSAIFKSWVFIGKKAVGFILKSTEAYYYELIEIN